MKKPSRKKPADESPADLQPTYIIDTYLVELYVGNEGLAEVIEATIRAGGTINKVELT
jgi:hypothetical protein